MSSICWVWVVKKRDEPLHFISTMVSKHTNYLSISSNVELSSCLLVLIFSDITLQTIDVCEDTFMFTTKWTNLLHIQVKLICSPHCVRKGYFLPFYLMQSKMFGHSYRSCQLKMQLFYMTNGLHSAFIIDSYPFTVFIDVVIAC